MEPIPLRAVGYSRVSSQEQTEGHSLDAQEVHIRNFIQSQNWQLLQIYTDAGVSAKKGSRRPAFERMLREAREGRFDVVVVDKIDRFYRHLGGLLSTLDQLNGMGVSLASVQEKLDFTTPWGKLMLTVLGMLAEIYIDNLRQETKKGHRQRARRGLWIGEIPYGYCNGLCGNCTDPNGEGYCPNFGKANLTDGKRLIAHPIESIGVRLVFEWYTSGEYSMTEIARMLSGYKVTLPDGTQAILRQKGHENHNGKGAFSKDVIRGILSRVAYIGKLPYVGFDDAGKYRSRQPPQEVFDGLQPALVSHEIFDEAAKIRETMATHPRKMENKAATSYLLTGILRCGYCGGTMRGVSNVKKYFWYKDGKQLDAVGDCGQRLVKMDILDDKIIGLLKAVVAQTDEQGTILAVQQQLALAEERFNRARELYLAGHINREYYEREVQQYHELENSLRSEEYHATIALLNFLRSELDRWDELLTIEKKRLLRLVLGGAWVQASALVAVQPTVAFLPLLREKKVGNCGEGGYRLSRA